MTVKEQPRRKWRRPGRLAAILLLVGLVAAAIAATSSGALKRAQVEQADDRARRQLVGRVDRE